MEVSIWCIFEWKWFKSSIINDDRSVRIEIDIKKYKNYTIEEEKKPSEWSGIHSGRFLQNQCAGSLSKVMNASGNLRFFVKHFHMEWYFIPSNCIEIKINVHVSYVKLKYFVKSVKWSKKSQNRSIFENWKLNFLPV